MGTLMKITVNLVFFKDFFNILKILSLVVARYKLYMMLGCKYQARKFVALQLKT